MKYCNKKMLNVLSSGASFKDTVSFVFRSNRYSMMSELDCFKSEIFQKLQDMEKKTKPTENNQYRKKYLR